jgi:4-oxalocrotonate tautomerase
MPLIEVKAFDRRFDDPGATERLIAGLTDALCEVFGEEVRDETWVIVDGVKPSHWGFGGEVRK